MKSEEFLAVFFSITYSTLVFSPTHFQSLVPRGLKLLDRQVTHTDENLTEVESLN